MGTFFEAMAESWNIGNNKSKIFHLIVDPTIIGSAQEAVKAEGILMAFEHITGSTRVINGWLA